MMTRDKFKDLLYKVQETNEFYEKVQELGVDLINCKYFDVAGVFFDELMKSEFGDSGLDTISWWLYEDVDHVICDGNNSEKVIADLNNIDDLYDYLTEGGRDAANE